MNDKVVYSTIMTLHNEEVFINESDRGIKAVIDFAKEKYAIIFGSFGILVFILRMILMFVDIVKTIFNKEELINFTMMMGINMMMFGVTLGCIGVIGHYIRRIFIAVKGRAVYN